MGIDVGTRHLGIGVYDRRTRWLRLMRVDLLKLSDEDGRGVLAAFEYRNVERMVRRVADDFDSFFRKARNVGVEIQMLKRRASVKFKVMELAFRVLLNERYGAGGTKTLSVAQGSVRSFFGTRVVDARLSERRKYELRKRKSVAALRAMLDDEDRSKLAKFKDKADDPIEAGLIALYLSNDENAARVQRANERGYTLKRRRGVSSSSKDENPVVAVDVFCPRTETSEA